MAQWVKDLALLLLWLELDPWPRNFCMPWVWPRKRERERERERARFKMYITFCAKGEGIMYI